MQRIVHQARKLPVLPIRTLTTNPSSNTAKSDKTSTTKDSDPVVAEAEKIATTQKSTKTMAEKDAELMQKLAGISGEGGESGVEYEDGKASAMKRSVKNNMFRLI